MTFLFWFWFVLFLLLLFFFKVFFISLSVYFESLHILIYVSLNIVFVNIIEHSIFEYYLSLWISHSSNVCVICLSYFIQLFFHLFWVHSFESSFCLFACHFFFSRSNENIFFYLQIYDALLWSWSCPNTYKENKKERKTKDCNRKILKIGTIRVGMKG